MSSWSLDKAPTWCPDAIATDRGWADPKNGHIIVACRRLKNAVPYEKRFDELGNLKSTRGGKRPGAGRKSTIGKKEVSKDASSDKEKVEIESPSDDTTE